MIDMVETVLQSFYTSVTPLKGKEQEGVFFGQLLGNHILSVH